MRSILEDDMRLGKKTRRGDGTGVWAMRSLRPLGVIEKLRGESVGSPVEDGDA